MFLIETEEMASGGSFSGDVPYLSEVRIVLVGYRNAGKSSSGNTILGREEFDTVGRTAQCVKRQGEVAGRQVTVVEAPGWWINFNLKDTPELTKQEIVLSVSLCPPGPHVVLLVIRVPEDITEDKRGILQEHLEFLSENVWSHTMVLFTIEDWLGNRNNDHFIEIEGALKSLVEKTGKGYHILNTANTGHKTQVTKLLKKIDLIVKANMGHHFEMDRKRLEETQEKRKKEEERAKERLMKVEKQRQHLQSLKSKSPPLSEFRVLLLGNIGSGKSSSGNTILGQEEFDLKRRTAQCVKRQGEVAGRQITVVEAPGWWSNVNLKDTPELTKKEIVLSVSLCPPGPHAVLLVIDMSVAITEDKRGILQEHLEFLSESVWRHTMVLFTCGDWLGDTTIEQYIESEGALPSLIEKCGNRYHVLNNANRGDDTQVTQLLEKIEEMVAGNRGHHFEMDRKRLEETQEKRKEEEERTKERLKVEKQRQHLQSLKSKSPPLSKFRVLLLGNRNAGKSSSGNTILCREEFDTVGRTAQCVKRQGEVAGRQVTVVEAPGWWSNINLKDTPELTKQEIVLSVAYCHPGPHAVLLVIDMSVAITGDKRGILQEHLEFLSERVWSHTMVLFTYGDWLGDTTIEQYIESEGALQSLVEKCGNRYHVLNNLNNTDDQVIQLLEKIEEMVAGNSYLQHVYRQKKTLAYSVVSGVYRSEMLTEESSAYGTHTSARRRERLANNPPFQNTTKQASKHPKLSAPSEQSYQDSINTGSSGIGSMSSGTLSGSREARQFRAEKTGPESGNSGRHYEMDRKRLEEMEERRKQQGAEDRQMEDRQMEDRQMDVLGQRDAHTVSVDEDCYESENCEAPGPSVAVLSHMSIPQEPERGHLGGQLPEKKGEVEDMCSAEDRECNGDVEVFTPEINTSEKTTYRFRCSSAGVFQCRYTGLVFKTDTAAEVQYHTASWDNGQLECESLMAAGPLFKMKGLQGTVSQLGFPHCEIISSDKTPPLTIIHISDKKFEMLQPLKTSDSHVFFNINGFSWFGLGKKRRREENIKCPIKALVILFLDESKLNIFLLPRNFDIIELCEKRKKLKQRAENYVDTISKCILIPDEKYSLTCPSEKHEVIPEIGTFDDSYGDCYPTFQVSLSIMEPIHLDLYKGGNEHEGGNEPVWKTKINLTDLQKRGTSAESRPSSPYTPQEGGQQCSPGLAGGGGSVNVNVIAHSGGMVNAPTLTGCTIRSPINFNEGGRRPMSQQEGGHGFFKKHKGELEVRLGILAPLLIDLERNNAITALEREEVESRSTTQEKNYTLMSMLDRRGTKAQDRFYEALKAHDPLLVEDIEQSAM